MGLLDNINVFNNRGKAVGLEGQKAAEGGFSAEERLKLVTDFQALSANDRKDALAQLKQYPGLVEYLQRGKVELTDDPSEAEAGEIQARVLKELTTLRETKGPGAAQGGAITEIEGRINAERERKAEARINQGTGWKPR